MSHAPALVVIDMQRQFTVPSGPFLVPDADGVVERVRTAVDRARARNTPVIWVMQRVRVAVGPGTSSRRFGQPGIHQGHHAELDARLDPESDIIVRKHRQSGFFGTDLDVVLRGLGRNAVILAGVTTNVCVLATAIDAAARDYRVELASDLTASLPVRNDGDVVLSAEDVQASAEAFFVHSLGEVTSSAEIIGIGR